MKQWTIRKTVSILGRLRQFATVPSRLQFARSGRWCSIARDYFSILWAPFPLLTYGNKTSVHIFTPVNGYTYMAYSLYNSSCHEDSWHTARTTLLFYTIYMVIHCYSISKCFVCKISSGVVKTYRKDKNSEYIVFKEWSIVQIAMVRCSLMKLCYNADLCYHIASLLQQQSKCRHVALISHIILIHLKQIFALTISCWIFSGEAAFS